MRESKTVEIAGAKYVIQHAHASVALKAAAILANGLAPLVNGFRRGKGGEIDRVLLGVAEAFADPTLSTNLEALCNTFKPYTQVILEGDRSVALATVFDDHFAGRLDALMAWLRAVVEYDLGGFLAEAKQKLDAARSASAAASASTSPPVAEKTG